MILINLLPHREAARKRRREVFFAALGAAAVAGVLVGAGVFAWYQAQISFQQERNQFLQGEIAKLDAQIKDIAKLQEEIAALRARQQAVEDLQANRNLPVHLLNELVKQLPDGVYVTNMTQENLTVTLKGVAQSNERVSELLRNLSYNSPWFTKPELIEVAAGNVSMSARDQRRVGNFAVRVQLKRASEVQAAASTPAGTASASAKAASASGAPAAL